MNILRGLFSVVLLALGLVGFAAPAQANPQQVLEGNYTFRQDGLPEANWSIYPVCVPVVGDLRAEIRDPLPIPVNKYPLVCEPGGLKRCW